MAAEPLSIWFFVKLFVGFAFILLVAVSDGVKGVSKTGVMALSAAVFLLVFLAIGVSGAILIVAWIPLSYALLPIEWVIQELPTFAAEGTGEFIRFLPAPAIGYFYYRLMTKVVLPRYGVSADKPDWSLVAIVFLLAQGTAYQSFLFFGRSMADPFARNEFFDYMGGPVHPAVQVAMFVVSVGFGVLATTTTLRVYRNAGRLPSRDPNRPLILPSDYMSTPEEKAEFEAALRELEAGAEV